MSLKEGLNLRNRVKRVVVWTHRTNTIEAINDKGYHFALNVESMNKDDKLFCIEQDRIAIIFFEEDHLYEDLLKYHNMIWEL